MKWICGVCGKENEWMTEVCTCNADCTPVPPFELAKTGKYDELKRLINEWIETEREAMREALSKYTSLMLTEHKSKGAITAYEQVLKDIAELEKELE